MCMKCMSSRSCLGHFSQFAIPTLMYISGNVFVSAIFGGGGFCFFIMMM